MELTYIAIALNAVLLVAVAALIVITLRLSRAKGEGGSQDVIRKLDSQAEAIKATVTVASDATAKALQSGMSATNEQVIERVKEMARTNEQRIGEMKEQLGTSLREMKEELERSLGKVRDDNAKQLESIRGTVDEKLTKTLDEKLTLSFQRVADSLDKLYKNLGELKSLDTSLTDLNKMLNGVKTRGNWGEMALEALLEEILVPQQYEKQSRMGRRTKDAVDFAIVLPGTKDDRVYLPIDSKFPVEDFVRMGDALLEGNAESYRQSRQALASAIKTQAISIKNKYIAPPNTTDFAIMYLPVESLYAEVLHIDGLAEGLQREYRVVVAGPTNIAALLNSLRMGFRTLQVQKNSVEVFKILAGFRKDFEIFIGDIERARSQMDTVQNTLGKAAQRTEIIRKKLAKTDGFEDDLDEGESSGTKALPPLI